MHICLKCYIFSNYELYLSVRCNGWGFPIQVHRFPVIPPFPLSLWPVSSEIIRLNWYFSSQWYCVIRCICNRIHNDIYQTRVWHSYGFWYKRISEYIRVKKMTRTNIRIYSYEIFWHERISEYICIKNLIRTNIRINIWIENIRIFKYIRHTLN